MITANYFRDKYAFTFKKAKIIILSDADSIKHFFSASLK